MQLDPRALKPKDVVIFGSKVKKTVYAVSQAVRCVAFNENDFSTGFDDPIWEIAELEKRTHPEKVGFYHREHYILTEKKCFGDNLYRHEFVPEGSGVGMRPNELLYNARVIVKQLEDAGVKDDRTP